MIGKYDVLAIGELNVDIIFTGLKGLPEPGKEIVAKDCYVVMGSSTARCANGLASLGLKVGFVGKVGNDYYGEIILKTLKKNRVDISNIIVDKKIKTGITISLIIGNDRALITNPGSIDELSIKDIDLNILNNTKHLHIGSYFLQCSLKNGIPELFSEAHKNNITTSLDPGWDVQETWNNSVFEALKVTDVFLPNETEAIHIAKEKDLNASIKKLSEYVGIIVVKQGKKGALACNSENIIKGSAYDTGEVIDTTGAGDSFNSGFIYGFINSYAIDKCIQYGNACGSISVSRIGGESSYATLKEVEELIQSGKLLEG